MRWIDEWSMKRKISNNGLSCVHSCTILTTQNNTVPIHKLNFSAQSSSLTTAIFYQSLQCSFRSIVIPFREFFFTMLLIQMDSQSLIVCEVFPVRASALGLRLSMPMRGFTGRGELPVQLGPCPRPNLFWLTINGRMLAKVIGSRIGPTKRMEMRPSSALQSSSVHRMAVSRIWSLYRLLLGWEERKRVLGLGKMKELPMLEGEWEILVIWLLRWLGNGLDLQTCAQHASWCSWQALSGIEYTFSGQWHS